MTNHTQGQDTLNTDVFIAGGGPVGLMLAIGLAHQGKKIILAERFVPKKGEADSVQNAFDGRVLALSKGSQEFLKEIGVWDDLQSHTTAIEHIHVSQKGYLGITTLHADEVDEDALGFSVQSSDLGSVLWNIAQASKNITLICPAELVDFNDQDSGSKINVRLHSEPEKDICILAQLVVGADGTQSKVREILGLSIEEKSYSAFGILAQVETEIHPNGWAYERFTEEGPVALLPMHGHFHKAVMVCSAERLQAIEALSNEQYLSLFADKMGERLGRFVKVSPRIVYPLKETYVPQMTQGRAVLMGNASHTQHPVAAQGLNLGIRDIEVFLQGSSQRKDLGEQAWLNDYAASRVPDHEKVMGLTDGLIQIFQHSSPIVGHLRGIGLMAMQAMPGLKRRFSKFAMRGTRA